MKNLIFLIILVLSCVTAPTLTEMFLDIIKGNALHQTFRELHSENVVVVIDVYVTPKYKTGDLYKDTFYKVRLDNGEYKIYSYINFHNKYRLMK